ncbi:MAG: hypothetical protein EOO77_03175 [Oxalobacteraceae bacterium]|nr:MAG: hypothetical protein EOO77_03175 [Oxalobacteraceae bacterium]
MAHQLHRMLGLDFGFWLDPRVGSPHAELSPLIVSDQRTAARNQLFGPYVKHLPRSSTFATNLKSSYSISEVRKSRITIATISCLYVNEETNRRSAKEV